MAVKEKIRIRLQSYDAQLIDAAAENADENVADDFDEVDLTAEDSDSTEE